MRLVPMMLSEAVRLLARVGMTVSTDYRFIQGGRRCS
jgi:hypothetical protein